MSYDLSQGISGEWIVHLVKNIPIENPRPGVRLVQSRGYLFSILEEEIILHNTLDSWEKIFEIGNDSVAIIPYLA